ncbi:hypothetical protein H0H93_013445, partial [Arthromyces matolae]
MRPQSVVYREPIKKEDGGRSLQRSRSFSRGRELPQTPVKDHPHPQEIPRRAQPPPSSSSSSVVQSRSRSQSQSQSRPSVPPNISIIESPSPRGGRDRKADIGRMESESESEHEHEHRRRGRQQQQQQQEHVVHSPVPVPLINIHPDGEEIDEEEEEEEDSVQIPRINIQGVSIPQINVQGAGAGAPPPSINVQGPPQIQVQGPPQRNSRNVPQINVNGPGSDPNINVNSRGPKVTVYEVPGVSVSEPGIRQGHRISSGQEVVHLLGSGSGSGSGSSQIVPRRGGGLRCGGCGEGIVGRIVSAMGQRWHPACFSCTVCGELLEHVSSYENEGKAYCHLDYHE